MNAIVQNLLKLQAIEFGNDSGQDKQIAELRAKVPEPILGHYNRLRARGKKGVAVVRNQVCTGCHMKLPVGVINTLMQDKDIQLCDSCGRYLYLDLTKVEPVQPAPVKPVKKRKAKTAAA
jgi:hypothetical protein